mmetsp:Transcript_21450/g.67777  ORF Transcript_21450/g.67777 Transcript_21450/m.67777 type:complete len:223 (+) Transcript_21450:2664-3332(+)
MERGSLGPFASSAPRVHGDEAGRHAQHGPPAGSGRKRRSLQPLREPRAALAPRRPQGPEVAGRAAERAEAAPGPDGAAAARPGRPAASRRPHAGAHSGKPPLHAHPGRRSRAGSSAALRGSAGAGRRAVALLGAGTQRRRPLDRGRALLLPGQRCAREGGAAALAGARGRAALGRGGRAARGGRGVRRARVGRQRAVLEGLPLMAALAALEDGRAGGGAKSR